nr:hypothetical protein [Limnobaculum allomyrinae]
MLNIDATTQSTALVMAARMYTPHGAPTAGDFGATVTINFTYD